MLCPDAKAYLRPFVVTSSVCVADFIHMATGQVIEDLATQMEAYNIAGLKGMFIIYWYIMYLMFTLVLSIATWPAL